MEFHLRTPEPPLSALVASITFFDGYQPAHDREVLIPDGSMYIIVDPSDRTNRLFAAPFTAEYTEFRHAWISGLQQRPITIGVQKDASLLVIIFAPGGAGPVLNLDVSALTDKVVALEQVLGRQAQVLRKLITESDGAVAKTLAARDWLLTMTGDRLEPDPIMAAMLRILRNQPGIGIGRMAEEIGYSERHTRNLFRRMLGVNPKQFARILRFQALLKHLATNGGDAASDPWLEKGQIPVPDWADVAQAFGYADQSHMNIDFRALSGFTPSGYVAAYRGLENFLPVTLAGS